LPVLIVSFFAMSGTGTPLFFSATAKVSMSSSMTLGRPPWWPSAAAGLVAFEGLRADVVAVELRGDGEHGEEHRSHAVGVVDAGERAGEEFELDASVLELAGEGHELGGVAGEALESSWTVRMTSWPGAASLMSYASFSAFSSSVRVLTRVEIFSEMIRLQTGPSATSWEASSWWAAEQRAYPIRMGFATAVAGAASTGGPGFHGRPGQRSSGTITASSSRSAGTRMKRAVWYFLAVFPALVRQELPAEASHFGQSFRSTAFAA